MVDSITVNEKADRVDPWKTFVASCFDAPDADLNPMPDDEKKPR